MSTQVRTKIPLSKARESSPLRGSILQRTCACGKSSGIDGQCEDCRARRLTSSSVSQSPTNTDAPFEYGANNDVSLKPSAGYNFSQVRIHTSAPQSMQTQLAINEPGDEYEQEADKFADTLMRMAEPGAPLLHVMPENNEQDNSPLMCKEGDGTSAQGVTSAPPIVSEVLKNNGGHALDTAIRAFMEPRLGYSLSNVRIHTDARAAESARGVNALAYTVGRDIVFGLGQYAPATTAGRRLLAHELTHVMQQGTLGGGKNGPTRMLQRQLITPLGQGGGYGGLMERDRRSRQKTPEEERAKSIPEAIQGGWRRIGELDEATFRTANIPQRIEMLTQLIQAYWTGSQEEEAINRIISTTPLSQSVEFLKLLSEEKINGKPFLDELDRVVDLRNNVELHNALSELRLKAVGHEQGLKALETAPILPWHDVMGLFEDQAVFFIRRTPNGKVKVKYPAKLFGSKDFANEVEKLPIDIFTPDGHEYEANQVLLIHDYDAGGPLVPVVAQELVGYNHSAIRGFLSHAATAASFGIPVGAAESVAGKIVLFTLERLLPAFFLFVDENRLNIVKWFPNWGTKMLYYCDLAQMGMGIYGIANFARSGMSIIKGWKNVRNARKVLEGISEAERTGKALEGISEAEQAAATLEKKADEIFAEVDKLQKSEGQAAQKAIQGGEVAASEVRPATGQQRAGVKSGAAEPAPRKAGAIDESELSARAKQKAEPGAAKEKEVTKGGGHVTGEGTSEVKIGDHEVKLSNEGIIERCSDDCLEFVNSVRRRLIALRRRLGGKGEASVNATALTARAQKLARQARELAPEVQSTLTNEQKALLKKAILKDAGEIEREMQDLEKGTVTTKGHFDFPHEELQAKRLGQLLGGGEFEALGDSSQGIEGFFSPKGSTEQIPVSLKDYSGTGRLANIIGRINNNAKQIKAAVQAGKGGQAGKAILHASLPQFTADAVRNFVVQGPIIKMPSEGVFARLFFDCADGVVVVGPGGLR